MEDSGWERRRFPSSLLSVLSLILFLASGALGQSHDVSIRFLESRVASDPEDFTAWNRLAPLYLQRVRETGSLDYLLLARRAVDRSLAINPDRNLIALASKCRVEFASHEFAASRDIARQLIDAEPDAVYAQMYLGDALLELGDYDGAADAYSKMVALGGNTPESLCRTARLAFLHGQTSAAGESFRSALALAQAQSNPVPETIAWIHCQLADLSVFTGDYAAGESSARAALQSFPNYFRGCSSLGKSLGAQGKFAEAITEYEKSIAVYPDPATIAALADLYHLTNREKDAQSQYHLISQITRLNQFAGILYNRNIAVFYANHDMQVDDAYAMAGKEYQSRKDIYGADAVAWTAYKSHHPQEAIAAIHEAMKLHTQDPVLFYHAGMIELTAGSRPAAIKDLRESLKLSPQFDPLQAPIAQRALDALPN
jgi:tetratricopeptide (TPR) repeat protein